MPATDSHPTSPASASSPRTVAVIDCGSSSLRSYIAEIRDGGYRVLDDLSHPVDLSATFTSGKLDRSEMDELEAAFKRTLQVARDFGVSQIRAVGTSALRQASNSDVLTERLKRETGAELEIIDCAEEGRLYFEALRELLHRNGGALASPTLFIDLGRGNAVASMIIDGKLINAFDDYVGTVRVYELFKRLKDSHDFGYTVDRYMHGAARVILRRTHRHPPSQVLVTGPDVRLVARRLRQGSAERITTIHADAIAKFWELLIPKTPRERAEALNLDEFEAALVMPTVSLLRHMALLTHLPAIQVPHLTLRDGLLADLLPGALGPNHLEREDLLVSAKTLAQDYGMDLAYAENTANLARQIFDQTADLHRMGNRERTLLEMASIIHDVGAFINIHNRHKHTQYIIENAELPGVTDLEKQIVAHVARYHRRSGPKNSHETFIRLPRSARVVISYLAAILRLAYGLDVERTQRIRTVNCTITERTLLIHADRRQIALERWSIDEKSDLFREVFGLDVSLVPRGAD